MVLDLVTAQNRLSFSWASLIPDSIVSVDRGYTDYKWLYSLEKSGVFFVMRTRKNMRYRVAGQHAEVRGKGVISDEIIKLEGTVKSEDYPEELRLVSFHDAETGKTLQFLTNNMRLAASTIAAIYKSRWQIELFFKWIKQNLRIKLIHLSSRDLNSTASAFLFN